MNNIHLNLVTSQIMPKVCWQRYFTNNIPAASIKVVRDVNLKVDTNTRNLGNCKLSYEGGKYYIQVGADAGTKKPLGSGLESAKKIIYRTVTDVYGVPKIVNTIEKDGDWHVCTHYEKGNVFDGWILARPFTEEYRSDGQPNGERQWHNYVDYVFDLKKFFPQDYRNWETKNFIFTLTNYQVYFYQDRNNNVGPPLPCPVSYQYDATTGILKVFGVSASSNENWGSDREDCNGGCELRVYGFELLIVS